MSHSDLVTAIYRAAQGAWDQLVEQHANDDVYGFALYTGSLGESISATAFTERGLDEVTTRVAERDGHGECRQTLRASLRWSACDSPLHAFANARFAAVAALLARRPDPYAAEREGERRLDACILALEMLDQRGVFGAGEARERVIVNLLHGDQSAEEMIDHALRLNSAAAVDRFRAELEAAPD